MLAWPPLGLQQGQLLRHAAEGRSAWVELVDLREEALEVRIGAEGLVSLVGELWQQGQRKAA
jgi:hypothetical protein